MKRSRSSETQIVNILKEAEAGIPVEELCRKNGFNQSAFYKWKAKYRNGFTQFLLAAKLVSVRRQVIQ